MRQPGNKKSRNYTTDGFIHRPSSYTFASGKVKEHKSSVTPNSQQPAYRGSRFRRFHIAGVPKHWFGFVGKWWRRQDKRWGWWWRAGNLAAALIIIIGILTPVVSHIESNRAYALSPAARQMVGKSDPNLNKQLIWDAQQQTWKFNAKSVDSSGLPLKTLRSTVGGSQAGKSLYSVTLPRNLSQGVTYTDINSQLSFSLIPEFPSDAGRVVDGHIVYPLAGGRQAIYTLKNNGLKEDVYVPGATNAVTLQYKLSLPKTLEAKIIPNSGGAIGVYSADPALYSNISFGSDKDRQRVEEARENGAKTYLVFGIPAPTIKAPRGQSTGHATARYQISGGQLSVIVGGTDSITTPISVDPSVVVTSASDFEGGNNEGGIDFSAGGISRGELTGGGTGAWTASSSTFTTGREAAASVIYNGYIYVIGGENTTGTPASLADIQYAALSSDGSIGSWQTNTANPLPTARCGPSAVAYNGYMYVLKGYTAGSGAGGYACRNGNGTSRAYYAKINSDGSIGTWNYNSMVTGPFSSGQEEGYGFAYNGYMYYLGGNRCSNNCGITQTQYAPIHADGTLGTWQTTTDLLEAIYEAVGAVYNGYVYMIGGNGGGSAVEYAPLNSDGTIGAWAYTTDLPGSGQRSAGGVYDGYLYVMGGNSFGPKVYFAPIYANGSVGAWALSTHTTPSGAYHSTATFGSNGYMYVLGNIGASDNGVMYAEMASQQHDTTGAYSATSSFITARAEQSSVAYNGYLYVLGGVTGGGVVNDVQYAKVGSDGTLSAWHYTHNSTDDGTTFVAGFTTPRVNSSVVANNGYMYILGGYDGTNQYNDVQVAAINADGTIGTWSATSSFMAVRESFQAVAYSGYMYVLGGYVRTSDSQLSDVQFAAINANGTLGAWHYTHNSTDDGTTFVAGFPTARDGFSSFAYNGYIYLTGGYNGTIDMHDTQYAPINANGTIGTWQATTDLPAGVEFSSAAINNGFVYVTGGWSGDLGSYLNAVVTAKINADGTLGSWYGAPIFSTPRNYQGTLISGGYLYILGGWDGSAFYNDVQYAVINSGGGPGTTGAWHYTHDSTDDSTTFVAGFATARYGLESIAYNGYLYVLGGYDGTTYYNDVQYAPINANGTIGSWATSPNTFLNGRNRFAAVVYDGYLYILGGFDGSHLGDVQYAPISSDGSVGTWQTTTSFINGRDYLPAVAYNGYMYVLGGYGSTYYNDVQFAAINANGTLGAWHYTHNSTDDGTTFVAGFTNARDALEASAYNGYMYIMGGFNSGTLYNDVQYAPINSNGTIGSWQSTASFATGRSEFVSSVYDGYLYIMGGNKSTSASPSSGQYLSDVQYAPILANGAIGSWQATSSLITARGLSSGAIYGGHIYSLGGYDGTNYLNDVQYASLASVPRIGRYSKLFDLGSVANLTYIAYTGTVPAESSVTYQTAGTDGIFGAVEPASEAAKLCIGANQTTRYVFVTVVLDDSGTGVSPDSAGTLAGLDDLTVIYHQAHPAPNIRLRGGQTLQTGVLSALDTCG